MANEKEQIKRQLEQQEQLASSLERATIKMETQPTTPSSSAKSGSGYPFSIPTARGKLTLPTALWVLLIMAGVTFLFLLGSLTKSIRTLNTLVEIELDQAVRETAHFERLEQEVSEAKRAHQNNYRGRHSNSDRLISVAGADDDEPIPSSLRSDPLGDIMGFASQPDSSWWPIQSSNSFGPDFKDGQREQSRLSFKEPRIISSSVEYVVKPNEDAGQLSSSPSSLINSLINDLMQDNGQSFFEAPFNKKSHQQQVESSDQDDEDDQDAGTQITANIDKIDIHINGKEPSSSVSSDDDKNDEDDESDSKIRYNNDHHQHNKKSRSKFAKANSQKKTKLVDPEESPLTISLKDENDADSDADPINNLLSLLFPVGIPIKQNGQLDGEPREVKGEDMKQPFNKRPFVKLTSDDAFLNSILDVINADQSTPSSLNSNNMSPFMKTYTTDERPQIPEMVSTQAPYMLSFGQPNSDWLTSDDLGGLGSILSKPSGIKNSSQKKSKMDAELESIANDMIESLTKITGQVGDSKPTFSWLSSSLDSTKKNNKEAPVSSNVNGDSVVLFSAKEPGSVGKDEKSQSLSISEEPVEIKMLASPKDGANEVNRLFQMFFGPPPSPDTFKFSTRLQPKKSSDDKKGADFDSAIPSLNIKSSTIESSPKTSSSPAEKVTSSTETTPEPANLDVFVDAVLDELLPTKAAQTSGDKSGAKVEDKKDDMTITTESTTDIADDETDSDMEISIKST